MGMAGYLLPIADREPLAWIVSEQRTAVGARRRGEAEALEPGDRVFLYTTRGCFRNPTRDRGRVIGTATVVRGGRRLDEPMVFGGREFHFEIRLRIEALAPYRTGVELAPLVSRMSSFPNRSAWSAYMRRALVPLTPQDSDLLHEQLGEIALPYQDAKQTYQT